MAVKDFTAKTETFTYSGKTHSRITWISASVSALGNATERTKGVNAPQPLSQYETGSSTPGARLVHTERGHLIGLQFGGPEASLNLVPMYAGFNSSAGGWGRFELDLMQYLLQLRKAVTVTISVNYTLDDPVPTSFGIVVLGENVPSSLAGFMFRLHPVPQVYYQELSQQDWELRKILITAQEKMMGEGWLIEDYIESPGRNSKLSVGEVDIKDINKISTDKFFIYASRPYAVLDYLCVRHPSEYEKFGFPFMSIGKINRKYQNVQRYSDEQIEAVQKTNMLLNKGFLISDLAFIPELERHPKMMLGSADAMAQVDHIGGKARSGSNAFSNGRLVSKVTNNSLNSAMNREALVKTYANDKVWLGYLKSLFS